MSSTPSTISFRGALYVLADEQRNVKRFLGRAQKAFLALLSPDSTAVHLAQRALENHPDDIKAAKAYWLRHAKALAEVQSFIKKFDRTGKKSKTILNRLRAAVFGADQAQTWQSLATLLTSGYVEWKREQAKAPLYESGLPEEIIKELFPKSFAVEVDPDQKIVREFEVFGNERKTIEKKRRAMVTIVKNWNKLVEQVNRDLESSDPVLKLTALATSIVMSTGIRIGSGRSQLKDDSGSSVKDEHGKPVYISTFGATTLKPEHVKFVRDDYLLMEFPGKAGTVNIATLSDPQLIGALKAQLNAVKEEIETGDGEDLFLFKTKDGRKISAKLVNRYIQKILGPNVSAHNFRHLKATETFYQSLRNREKHLARRLFDARHLAVDDLRKRVVSEVYNVLKSAAEETQEYLSHDKVETTLESYIHPNVVLTFLTDAGLEPALDAVIGDGRGLQLSFDPLDFFSKVQERHVAADTVTASTKFFYGDKFVDYDVDDTIVDLAGEAAED